MTCLVDPHSAGVAVDKGYMDIWREYRKNLQSGE